MRFPEHAVTEEDTDGHRSTCEILCRPVHQYPRTDADWINLKDLETSLLYRVTDQARVVDRTFLDREGRERIREWLERNRVPGDDPDVRTRPMITVDVLYRIGLRRNLDGSPVGD